MGKKECIVLDCQWTLANAHRVIAEIIDSQLELKAIFATHSHPTTTGAWRDAAGLPNAKCYMLPEDLNLYNHQYQAKLDEWEPVMGKNNLCRKQAENIIPLTTGYLELEGERLEVFDHVMGRLPLELRRLIPSIKTVYGSDVLFNQAHPSLRGHGPQRAQWIADIEKMEKLGAEVVIPATRRKVASLTAAPTSTQRIISSPPRKSWQKRRIPPTSSTTWSSASPTPASSSTPTR
jgi:glyoxylase-like metal-dependent hydrolase (beta-lactamase superfamily II)